MKIKSIFNNNNNKYLLLAIVIIGFAFYWYQIRPVLAKSNCDIEARDSAKEEITFDNAKDVYTLIYQSCLHKKGY